MYVQMDGSGGGGALNTGAGISAAKDTVLQQRKAVAIAHWRSLQLINISQLHDPSARHTLAYDRPIDWSSTPLVEFHGTHRNSMVDMPTDTFSAASPESETGCSA